MPPKGKENKLNFHLPDDWLKIETIDMHTGGEPLRIIVSGLPKLEGNTLLQKRRFFIDHFDHVRTGIILEPRGHNDMYGAVLTEASSPEADFGVFFIHNQGYSSMCGHAIIALTKFVIETGLIPKPGQNPELRIETPAGIVIAKPHGDTGKIKKSSFLNVPSFLYLKERQIHVGEIGDVKFDIAFGGAFYAICNGNSMGLKLIPSEYHKLVEYGMEIKQAVTDNFQIEHPVEKELGFLYGTIFTGRPENQANHSRNVCIFADGEVDRSATGTGVSARAALHFAKSEMNMNESYTIESISGTTMDVKIIEETRFGNHHAVIPEVSGSAFYTGENIFYFDPDDPLNKGFNLR